MADITLNPEEILTSINKLRISPPPEYSSGRSGSSSSPSTIFVEEELPLPSDINASLLSKQPWICDAGVVRHRLRGILLTHDTYDILRLSFKSDYDSRSFIGRILGAMASMKIIRMTEIQLEELNKNWDEEGRGNNQQFAPLDRPLLVCMQILCSISTQWALMKTLYYVALSQDLLETLFEDAIIRIPLTALTEASHQDLVSQIPNRHPLQIDFSVEKDLEEAIYAPKPQAKKIVNSIPLLIENLVNMVRVGRRDRSEPFLSLHETTIRRRLQRGSMENLPCGMEFVYSSEAKTENRSSEFYGLRVFLTRRLVGSIARSNLGLALAEGLTDATRVNLAASSGQAPLLKLDGNAKSLIHRAQVECCPEASEGHDTRACLSRGLIENMFVKEKQIVKRTL